MTGTMMTTGRHDRTAVYRSSVWSTRVDLVVTDPGVVVEAARLLHAFVDRVDAVASRFRADSEVRQLQRSSDGRTPVPVSGDLGELVAVSLRAARLTDGAVDPTVGAAMCRIGYDRDFALVGDGVAGAGNDPVPVVGWQAVQLDRGRSMVTMPAGTLLDFGATAKAWAADRAAEMIAFRTGSGILVSLGGDVAVAGTPPPAGFSVGIADVCGDPNPDVTVAIESGGLATSGIARRHWTVDGEPVHHLIDPSTGRPADGPWRTVTVAAGSCTDANTAATAAVVIGDAAPRWLEDQHLPARLVRRDGSTTTVGDWPAGPTPAGMPPTAAQGAPS